MGEARKGALRVGFNHFCALFIVQLYKAIVAIDDHALNGQPPGNGLVPTFTIRRIEKPWNGAMIASVDCR